MTTRHLVVVFTLLVTSFACAPAEEQAATTDQAPPTMDLFKEASLRFAPLPSEALNPDNPVTQAKIDLGKKLYYDTRALQGWQHQLQLVSRPGHVWRRQRTHIRWR